jgi:PAS domain S-box-containing protein
MTPLANAASYDQLPLTALEVVANGVVITDPAGTILWVNPAFTRMTGYSFEEALGRTPRLLKSGAHPPELYRDLWITVRSGRVWTGEMLNRRKDGSTYFEEQTITPVQDGAGRISHYIAIKQDITARKQAEEALRHGELQWRALIAAAPVAIIGLEPGGRVTTWNPAAAELFGWSEREAADTPAVLDAALGHTPEYRALLTRAESGAAIRDVRRRGRRRDGTPVDLSVSIAALGAAEEPRGFILLVSDVTEKNRIEASLRESEQRYRLLAENVSDVISVFDMNLRLVYVSPSVLQLRGYTPAEAMSQSMEQRLTPASFESAMRVLGEELSREHAAAGSQACTRTLDVELTRKDGGTVWAEAKITFLRDGHGQPQGFISVARDISDRRRMEAQTATVQEQLRQAQKMEAIGRLAGGIAHDFNNLLTVMMGRSQMACRRLAPGDPVRQDVEAIEKTGQRAAALTRQLLAFSRQQVLQPRVLDLNAVVSGVEALLRRVIGEDIELITSLATDPGATRADPSQIEQVLLNLAVNSRDAMPRGGRLTIETANVELDPGEARALDAEAGAYVRLTVADTGHGMDEATRARIFEPFFTTKEPGKGTGLGLATVHGVVRQTGGHIGVETAAGRGTTFRIYLPRVSGTPDPAASAAPAAAARGTEAILLVEDDVQVRALAREILEASGYAVLEAVSPDEALALAGGPRRIDLLLSDIVMPGMNGVDLARRVRQARPGIRVLYMSGHTGNAVTEEAALDPGLVLLQKPFTMSTLTAKIREALDAAGAPRVERRGAALPGRASRRRRKPSRA